ncbi:TfoX/Sxy family protein [Microbulbifer litoralis]|uniref:TfoX/Sxy family protein n=1 Tax=Microbulbifer litoralis TaxID=2933965 RepID=UPI002028563A|nr:TfoX/Sxy family protein [Microbulbifer sp. GX H0434]
MSSEEELLSRVRKAFSQVPNVTERRMFGSMGFLVNGNLCIGCRPERIMCRIDPELHDKAIAQNGCRTVVMRGHEYRGWVYVDADSVRTQHSLKRWIDQALSYVESLPPKER